MQSMKRLWLFGALALGFCGCNTITNLTPSQMARNSTGLYTVEAAWSSRQQAIRADSMHPSVKIGDRFFPMQATPVVPDRWEVLIPVATNESLVHYRFKFDYQVNSIPAPVPDSRLSGKYTLKITDK